jgi:hypothetical protein
MYAALTQIDLVEASPIMRSLQKEKLQCIPFDGADHSSLFVERAQMSDGIPVVWYTSVLDLPKGIAI